VCCWGSVFPWQASPRFSLESWRTFCQSHTALCGPFNPLAPDWMVRRGGAAILSLHKRSPVPVLYGIGKVLRVGPWSWRGLWSFRSSRQVSPIPGNCPPRAAAKKESRPVPEETFRADWLSGLVLEMCTWTDFGRIQRRDVAFREPDPEQVACRQAHRRPIPPRPETWTALRDARTRRRDA
jgi:hypothetical protein